MRKTAAEELKDEQGRFAGLRVPLTAMDGLDNVQRAVIMDTAPKPNVVVDAYLEYDKRVGEAWKKPLTPEAPPAPHKTNDAVADAYAAYDHALTNAWRGANGGTP